MLEYAGASEVIDMPKLEILMQSRAKKVVAVCLSRAMAFASCLVLTTVILAVGAKDSAAGYCPLLRVTTYYTDASKTVICGWVDSCAEEQEGCITEYYTYANETCCSIHP